MFKHWGSVKQRTAILTAPRTVNVQTVDYSDSFEANFNSYDHYCCDASFSSSVCMCLRCNRDYMNHGKMDYDMIADTLQAMQYPQPLSAL
jgi:hypothetical protein